MQTVNSYAAKLEAVHRIETAQRARKQAQALAGSLRLVAPSGDALLMLASSIETELARRVSVMMRNYANQR